MNWFKENVYKKQVVVKLMLFNIVLMFVFRKKKHNVEWFKVKHVQFVKMDIIHIDQYVYNVLIFWIIVENVKQCHWITSIKHIVHIVNQVIIQILNVRNVKIFHSVWIVKVKSIQIQHQHENVFNVKKDINLKMEIVWDWRIVLKVKIIFVWNVRIITFFKMVNVYHVEK